jgi:sec-independent protein translocase protein TatB
MDFFGIGTNELLIIALLAALILGPRRLGETARRLGRLSRDVKNYFRELTGDFSRELEVLDQLKSTGDDLNRNLRQR